MTLLWFDGFEGFTNGGNRTVLDPVYDFKSDVSTNEVGVFSPGAYGIGRAVFADDANAPGSFEAYGLELDATALSSQDDWIVGFAFRCDETEFLTGDSNSFNSLLQFLDSDSPTARPMISIYSRAGTLAARATALSGLGSIRLGSANATVLAKNWHFLECKVKLHPTAGNLVLRLDGQEVMNLTGVVTAATAAMETFPTKILFGGSASNVRVEIDNIYVCDDQGSQHNDFLGETAVKKLMVNGDGTTTEFTPSSGTTHWLMVDDDDPDDDVTYNFSATTGHKDLYAIASLPTTPAAIEAVSAVSYGRKTDSGAKTFNHVVRSGATESDSPAITLLETYRHHYSIYPQDPATSAAWGAAAVNAMEAGVKLAS